MEWVAFDHILALGASVRNLGVVEETGGHLSRHTLGSEQMGSRWEVLKCVAVPVCGRE